MERRGSELPDMLAKLASWGSYGAVREENRGSARRWSAGRVEVGLLFLFVPRLHYVARMTAVTGRRRRRNGGRAWRSAGSADGAALEQLARWKRGAGGAAASDAGKRVVQLARVLAERVQGCGRWAVGGRRWALCQCSAMRCCCGGAWTATTRLLVAGRQMSATVVCSGSWQQRERVRGEKGARRQRIAQQACAGCRGRILGQAQASGRPQSIDGPNCMVGRLRSGKASERPGNECGGSGKSNAKMLISPCEQERGSRAVVHESTSNHSRGG